MDLFRQIDQKTYKHVMPKYPVLVLTTHVAIKGLELGSVCGYLAFALTKPINLSDLGPWAKYTSRGPFILSTVYWVESSNLLFFIVNPQLSNQAFVENWTRVKQACEAVC